MNDDAVTNTTILLPSHPMDRRAVDPDFAEEDAAAREFGFRVEQLSLDALLAGNVESACARLEHSADGARLAYRGWMVTSDQYATLERELRRRGFVPVNSALTYRLHHEYPGAWSRIPDLMPPSVVLGPDAVDHLEAATRRASTELVGPVLLKDYVKSRKHEWFEACFIPDIGNVGDALRVVSNFVRLQGDTLQGGLVFRRMLELVTIGKHPQSALPIPVEYRTFFLGGKPLVTARYWDEGEYGDAPSPPEELLLTIGERMGTGFFAADTALGVDGRWYVIETGDGQVSQIPDALGARRFYEALASAQ